MADRSGKMNFLLKLLKKLSKRMGQNEKCNSSEECDENSNEKTTREEEPLERKNTKRRQPKKFPLQRRKQFSSTLIVDNDAISQTPPPSPPQHKKNKKKNKTNLNGLKRRSLLHSKLRKSYRKIMEMTRRRRRKNIPKTTTQGGVNDDAIVFTDPKKPDKMSTTEKIMFHPDVYDGIAKMSMVRVFGKIDVDEVNDKTEFT